MSPIQSLIISNHSKVLQDVDIFYKKMLTTLSEKNSYKDMCEIFYELVGYSVAVIGSNFNLIDYSVDFSWENYVQGIGEVVTGQLMANLVALQKNTYRFYLDGPTRHFFGATPERLLKATASEYLTASVAGTIRRGQTPKEDAQLANLLLNDAKNTKEHQIVVEAIQGKLAPFVNGQVALGPRQILKNEQVQHIFLTLTGQRQEKTRFLEVIENLHPTPALGGNPKEAALTYLQANENLDRGLYGAPIGFYRLFEDSGEFVVGIRSGVYGQGKEIYGECFAGCGIVQDSNAEEEFEETKLKFEPMKRGLLGLE